MIGTLHIRLTKAVHPLLTTGMIALCLIINGCATYEPVQKGYAGATAKLANSVAGDGAWCASFFFLEAYDGHDDVKFTPQGDGQYTVKGELREDHDAVWVEKLSTAKQCGNKLLIKGSTALNRGALPLLGTAAAKPSNQKVEEIPLP
jgi:hypothetical protein